VQFHHLDRRRKSGRFSFCCFASSARLGKTLPGFVVEDCAAGDAVDDSVDLAFSLGQGPLRRSALAGIRLSEAFSFTMVSLEVALNGAGVVQLRLERQRTPESAPLPRVFAPIFFRFAPYRRRRGIFRFDPVPGPPGNIGRAEPLRNNSFEAELARVRRTLYESLDKGEEPTRAKLKRAVRAKTKRKRRPRRNLNSHSETQHDRDLRMLLGV
jgi:hypothetical protein